MNGNVIGFEATLRFFRVGTTIEHHWFRGKVVGLNFRDRTMDVRITGIIRQGPRSRLGRIMQVPFNCGREVRFEGLQ